MGYNVIPGNHLSDDLSIKLKAEMEKEKEE